MGRGFGPLGQPAGGRCLHFPDRRDSLRIRHEHHFQSASVLAHGQWCSGGGGIRRNGGSIVAMVLAQGTRLLPKHLCGGRRHSRRGNGKPGGSLHRDQHRGRLAAVDRDSRRNHRGYRCGMRCLSSIGAAGTSRNRAEAAGMGNGERPSAMVVHTRVLRIDHSDSGYFRPGWPSTRQTFTSAALCVWKGRYRGGHPEHAFISPAGSSACLFAALCPIA